MRDTGTREGSGRPGRGVMGTRREISDRSDGIRTTRDAKLGDVVDQVNDSTEPGGKQINAWTGAVS